jgi:hypothetical protein
VSDLVEVISKIKRLSERYSGRCPENAEDLFSIAITRYLERNATRKDTPYIHNLLKTSWGILKRKQLGYKGYSSFNLETVNFSEALDLLAPLNRKASNISKERQTFFCEELNTHLKFTLQEIHELKNPVVEIPQNKKLMKGMTLKAPRKTERKAHSLHHYLRRPIALYVYKGRVYPTIRDAGRAHGLSELAKELKTNIKKITLTYVRELTPTK